MAGDPSHTLDPGNLIPSNTPAPLEIDQDNWDADSAFGSTGNDSRHTSLKSFVRDYYYENGRRYHSFRQGEYNMPNDDREQERLEYFHCCWLMLRGGKLFNAPIGDSPQRILDLGTGTGTWAIEFADRYPGALVIGNDLSPIQPFWVPPNCKFEVDDIASPWIYRANEAFDFIHSRMLNGSIADWPRLYKQAFQNLKPGGWIELQEFDGWVYSDSDPELRNAPVLSKVMQDVNAAAKAIDKDMDIAHAHKDGLVNAGFVDVTEDLYKVPFGRWSTGKQNKVLGELALECVGESIDAYGFTMMTRFYGKSAEEARDAIAKATEEFKDRNNHFFGRFRFIYGRKPEAVD